MAFARHRIPVAWQAVVGVIGAAFVVFTVIACYTCIHRRRRRNGDDSTEAGRVVTSWGQFTTSPEDPSATEETMRLTSDTDVPLSQLPDALRKEDVGRIPDPTLHPQTSLPSPAYEAHRV